MAKVLKRDFAEKADPCPVPRKRGRKSVKTGEAKIFMVNPVRFRISLHGSLPLGLPSQTMRVWHGGKVIAPVVVDVNGLRARCACGAFSEYCLPQFCPGAIDSTYEL